MRKHLPGLLLGCLSFVLSVSLCAVHAHAAPPVLNGKAATPSPQGIFTGEVRDILTKLPVASAYVHLRGATSGVRTDRDGRYQLSAPIGACELVVEAPHYVGMSQTQLQVLSGKTLSVDFELVPSNPDPTQEEQLFYMFVKPNEQDGADDEMVSDVSASAAPSTIRVVKTDGSVVQMDMDEYLKGVVPAEIGVWSDIDALKAQAIAARSYAATSYSHSDVGANVCTTTHCQVWTPQHYETTDQAVEETSGMVATYGGDIIRAYYFGHCDGHTRNSEDVWWATLPYCRSVECVCGYTTMYGHGVGMCQRGAIEMARQGASFDEIIRHYYTGVSITGLQPTPTPMPSVTPTATPNPRATITYQFAKGWNLFSIPMALDDYGVAAVFAPISGKYDLVMQYDAFEPYARWKAYNSVIGGETTLDQIDTRYGIWIRTFQSCSLTLTGDRVIAPTDIPLTTGLNLVGYPSMQARPVGDAVSSIYGKYIRIYTYDASVAVSPWQLFDFTAPTEVNALTQMQPGQGYWIQAVQPTVWQVQP